jgi:hypothetical protein
MNETRVVNVCYDTGAAVGELRCVDPGWAAVSDWFADRRVHAVEWANFSIRDNASGAESIPRSPVWGCDMYFKEQWKLFCGMGNIAM